jgi:hypothetical protein
VLRNVQNTQLRRELGLAPGFGYLWPCYPRMRDNLRGYLIPRSAPILSLDTRSGLHSIGGHDVTISKEISLGLLSRFCKLGFVVSAATWFAASNARGQGYSRLGVCRMCERPAALCSVGGGGVSATASATAAFGGCTPPCATIPAACSRWQGLSRAARPMRTFKRGHAPFFNVCEAKRAFPRPGEYSTVGARL